MMLTRRHKWKNYGWLIGFKALQFAICVLKKKDVGAI
jgi:hypothetical protein